MYMYRGRRRTSAAAEEEECGGGGGGGGREVGNFSRDDYLFKKYLKFLNRLYHITWFGAVYA